MGRLWIVTIHPAQYMQYKTCDDLRLLRMAYRYFRFVVVPCTSHILFTLHLDMVCMCMSCCSCVCYGKHW